MYDMAKRSLAFTVATGGLLLTGTGYAPAEAAVGFGTLPGPAQAQGADILKASPSSVSAPISVRGPESPAQAAPRQDVHVLTPAAPHVPSDPGSGAAASSTVKNSGGILSGNSVQIPIDLGLNLCTNQVDAIAVGNHVAPGGCGGPNAAGGANSGSSATVSTSHSGGILSGNTIQAPVNVPLNVCGNQAVGIGLKNTVHGAACPADTGTGSGGSGAGGGSSATAVTDRSGGILSGNIIQAPINVPVNACGNQANVITAKDKVLGNTCSTNPSGTGTSGGSSATAVVLNSGGIGSGMIVQTPINVPVNACGNQATVGGLDNRTGGSTCINQSGTATASSVTANSGGIASGTSAQVPINVPVNVCGDQGSVIGIDNKVRPALCGQGSMPSPSGSPSNSPSGTPSTSPSTSASGTPSACSSCSPSPSSSSSTSASPSNAPTTTSPGTPSTPAKPHGGGSLAGTGTEEGAVLAVAGAALLAGAGLRSASKRGRRAR